MPALSKKLKTYNQTNTQYTKPNLEQRSYAVPK